jgi:hypothetical protein
MIKQNKNLSDTPHKKTNELENQPARLLWGVPGLYRVFPLGRPSGGLFLANR